MVIAEISIELKPGIADPEGQNTKKTLELLGFKGVKEVRSIKVFEVEMDMLPEGGEERPARRCAAGCSPIQ